MKAVSIHQQSLELTSPSFLDVRSKGLVLKWLEKIQVGHLVVNDGDTSYHYGEPESSASLIATVNVSHPRTYRDILFHGTIGAGEAYMRGAWQTPDLTAVIRLLCANIAMMQSIDGGWARIGRVFSSIFHRLHINNKQNSRLNIAAHYDLGNDFFKLFLDDTMMYSSAIFPSKQASLYDASVYKLAHICERLQLKPSDHLLEIGTGWGGMAVYAAKHYGCRVTTTTISKEQYDYACENVKRENLEDKVTVLLDDYRDLGREQNGEIKKFDKLVSIEMIEAVGHQYYQQYFSTCAQLLKPDGLMLIQAITVPDQRYEVTKKSADFIQRYIFPGGELPSIAVIGDHVKKDSDLQIVGIDDITLDYARTLKEWRLRFFDKIDDVKAQGFDDVFIRMWEFYLCYCEGGFAERTISTVQMLMAKPRFLALPQVKHV